MKSQPLHLYTHVMFLIAMRLYWQPRSQNKMYCWRGPSPSTGVQQIAFRSQRRRNGSLGWHYKSKFSSKSATVLVQGEKFHSKKMVVLFSSKFLRYCEYLICVLFHFLVLNQINQFNQNAAVEGLYVWLSLHSVEIFLGRSLLNKYSLFNGTNTMAFHSIHFSGSFVFLPENILHYILY